MASRILTPANQITILRLAFIPFFAILVVAQKYRGALAVLTAAALSDMVDGTVARLLKQETPLGVALDPIADKLLMTTAYLTLVISLVAGYRPFRPTILGKASTAAQVATVFAAVSFQAHVPFVPEGLVQICVYLAAALTVVSGIHYVIVVRKRYGQHASEQAGEIK